ncbi:MAG: hypothetical protein AB7V46_20155 [Thermomicrobiales bacterium]
MTLSRRTLVGGLALASAVQVTGRSLSLAQEAGTPEAMEREAPGYAIVRVRALPEAELNQAIYPHVMHRFLPEIQEVPGFASYFFAFHDDDPSASITMTLTSDEAAGVASNEAAVNFVGGLDPRFAVETPLAQEGPLRIFGMTERPVTELSPFLHGYKLTVRDRQTAEGADIEAVIAQARDELLPLMTGMDGFVMYAWILTPTGRVAINIWESAEQQAAGDQAVADFVANNTVSTTVGEPVVNTGTIGYAAL